MNVLLTNTLQIIHVNLQELYPSLNYLQHLMSLLPPSGTVKILEMINICVQRVLNNVNKKIVGSKEIASQMPIVYKRQKLYSNTT